jgi:hypothetical protein
MFPDPTPRLGDSDNILLFKICQMWNERCGGDNPPRLLDSDNNLLYKIAKIVSTCISCVDPAAPSGLTASPPNPGSLVEWDDNADNETGYEIRYRNITQGGGFVSWPAVGANVEQETIDVAGANDADQIEIQVRAINGSCFSEWVGITVAAEIFN